MPIRSTTHCKKSLRPQAVVFLAGYTQQGGKIVRIPVRVSVFDVYRSQETGVQFVEIYPSAPSGDVWGAYIQYYPGRYYFSPGDKGVRGYRYDSRAEQCFTTRKACEAAIKRWGDENPNLIHRTCKGDAYARRF